MAMLNNQRVYHGISRIFRIQCSFLLTYPRAMEKTRIRGVWPMHRYAPFWLQTTPHWWPRYSDTAAAPRRCSWRTTFQTYSNVLRNSPICDPWCWNIYQHLPHKSPSFVGKYTIHGSYGSGLKAMGHQHCLSWASPNPSFYDAFLGNLTSSLPILEIHGTCFTLW